MVVFGGDREAGRLARAYCDLQQKESKYPRLTKTCKLQFYFVPTKRRTTGEPGGGGPSLTEGQIGNSYKAAMSGVRTSGAVTFQPTQLFNMYFLTHTVLLSCNTPVGVSVAWNGFNNMLYVI